MKIILTGATGFVGGEVLEQLLAHPQVAAVTSLARRPLARAHPKLRAIAHADFARYDSALLESLADHGACVWALGGKASDAADPAVYEQVTHGFTLALARALAAGDRPLSFGYLSGMGADPSETARLPWERTTRHLKGRTERDLAALAAEHPQLTAYAFRPAGILPRDQALAAALLRPIAVPVQVLARAMIRVALEGAPDRTLSNAQIRRIGSV